MVGITVGGLLNIALDPLFIFVFGLGIKGAAIATIISQTLSAAFVLYFLHYKAEYRIRFLSKTELAPAGEDAKKYRQPRNCRIYYAADQQSCHYLRQQCPVRYRR